MKTEYIKRELLPQHDKGVDWGKDRYCFIKAYQDNKPVWTLFWVPGQMGWSGRGCAPSYYAPHLTFLRENDTLGDTIILYDAPRLSAKLFKDERVAAQIDKLAGVPVAHMIVKSQTLLLDL